MKFLCVDPGEDTGWAIFEDGRLVVSGTEKLWAFAEIVYDAVVNGVVGDDELSKNIPGVELFVVEDFRLYPWEARKGSLDFDPMRTPRLIGALTIIARMNGLRLEIQPAKIKERAEAAGAESLFSSPLHENRHANDAIRHGVYYLARQMGANQVLAN